MNECPTKWVEILKYKKIKLTETWRDDKISKPLQNISYANHSDSTSEATRRGCCSSNQIIDPLKNLGLEKH